ncbi:FxsA family protein [Roseimaritima ulvae]|uniref:Phage T7 F exclusion suppressor FxsA n=1 Tax=Roseimaritima ulvae TaxID=980254 RepID=A0A5B9QQ06_9BACT|nr:FxsA family protein [Roseimaritima ulvae]QEG39999.1 phage T7 F exclusion suppressor FxsA [Roseimaritima ulvae]
MIWRIFLAFTLIPLVELFLLWKLTTATSLPTTVLLVLVTGFVGSLLARRQGIQAWRRFHLAIGEGRMPGKEIQDGLLIAFAAAMLLTPGLLTDVAGFLLLIPVTREMVRGYLASKLKHRFHLQIGPLSSSRPGEGFSGHADDVVDAEGVHPVDHESSHDRLPPRDGDGLQ